MRNLSTVAIGLSLALALAACTPAKRRRSDPLALKRSQNRTLSMDELTDDGSQPPPRSGRKKKQRPGPTPPPSPAKASPAAPPLSPRLATDCTSLVQRYVPRYQALFQLIPPNTYVPSGSPLDHLLELTPRHCQAPGGLEAALRTLSVATGSHSGQIGVILPLSGPRAKASAHIVQGMRAAFQEAGQNFDQLVVLKDSGGTAKGAETELAQLVFRHQISLVIGGLDRPEAEILAQWGAALEIPALLLTRERALTAGGATVFSVYPDEKKLADTLADAAKKRGFARFAILRPTGGKSDKLVEHFKEAVSSTGGTVVKDLVYTPQNYPSMQAVARELFKTEAAERSEEYRQAYKKARKAAQEQGMPFDPRMVVLKPIVDFDALFLPDDFRTVRHFTKLFKYHMVERLPLIGNHEWRSPGLVEPPEDFLEGAIFADFIGSYAKLPTPVTAPTLGSPYFVHPRHVAQVDFQLVGYRAAKVGRLALLGKPGSRRQLVETLAKLPSNEGTFFGQGPVFDPERHGNWPTFLFTIQKGQVLLEGTETAAHGSLAAPHL